MMLGVDKKLENTSVGIAIEAESVARCVPLSYIHTPVNNAVLFKRQLVSPDTQSPSYTLEDNMAVILPMSDMVDLVISVS